LELILTVGVHELAWVNAVLLQVLVVLELVEFLWHRLVWWALVLAERGVVLVLFGGHVEHAGEVKSGEDTVVWDGVVQRVWLEVVQVAEVGGVAVTEPERLVRVAIVNTVAFLALHETDQSCS